MDAHERERAAALESLSQAYARGDVSTATLEARVAEALRADAPLDALWDLPTTPPRTRRPRAVAPPTRLVVLDGEEPARHVPLDAATLAIGRARSCGLRLANTSVSREHALLSLRGGRCRVRDLGSTNGTLLNGVPVTVADVHAGDELVLGEVVLRVR